VRRRENLSPLERYEIGQLKLVGVIWDIKNPTALVEDSTGLGYTVKVGTAIGPNDGKIKAIKPDALIIEEEYIDLYGVKKRQEVSMRLPVEKSE
jgi:type IV pilus assembly protein PilP